MEEELVLYGKAGPAVFQQWEGVERAGNGGNLVRQKVHFYTISLPGSENAVRKLMGGCKKQGPEITTGIDADLLEFIKASGGAKKFDGELPTPLDSS